MQQEKKKFTRCSPRQKELLVEYMASNKMFATSSYSGPLGAAQLAKEWEHLSQALNENGPYRTPNQWKLTWRDLKSRARHQNAAAQKARAQTGNFAAIPLVSEAAQKILGTIGKASSEGIGPNETAVGPEASKTAAVVPSALKEPIVFFDDTINYEEEVEVIEATLPQRPIKSTSNKVEFLEVQNKNNELIQQQNQIMKARLFEDRVRNKQLREQIRLLKRNPLLH